MSDGAKKCKILFFAPHTAIWQHAFPEALIAESLIQSGNEVVYVTCGEQFKKYCVAMRSSGLTQESPIEEKQQICDLCNAQKSFIKENFKFTGYDLSEKLSKIDLDEISGILKKVNKENFKELNIDGINLGRVALYEFLLQHKKIDLNLSDLEWSRYLIALENTLCSFYVSRKILDQEKPDRIVIYNTFYSVNLTMAWSAERRGIPCYHIHAGGNLAHRLTSLSIIKGDPVEYMELLKREWKKQKEIPCSKEEIERTTDHMVELLKGKNVFAYSSSHLTAGVDIRKFFEIKKDQKIVVAALSSPDEWFAYDSLFDNVNYSAPLFGSQLEWIKALVEYFKSRPELFLIVRVHPREFPNKREGVLSQHAQLLQEQLTDLPSNIKVNWPKDNISIYALADETDVFLNCWSSIGKEMSLLGIPCVIYNPTRLMYPPDLNYFASTKKGYFEKIEQALRDGWNFERVRMAYRWFALEYERSLISISESFKGREWTSHSRAGRGLNKLRRIFQPLFSQNQDFKDRKNTLFAQKAIDQVIRGNLTSTLDLQIKSSANTLDEETLHIKKELGRLKNIMFDPKSRDHSPLHENLEAVL